MAVFYVDWNAPVVNLTDAQLAQIDKQASKSKIQRSALIRQAVLDSIEKPRSSNRSNSAE